MQHGCVTQRYFPVSYPPGGKLGDSIGGHGSWSPTCLVAAPGLCYTLHQLPLQTLGFRDAHKHCVWTAVRLVCTLSFFRDLHSMLSLFGFPFSLLLIRVGKSIVGTMWHGVNMGFFGELISRISLVLSHVFSFKRSGY